MRTVITTLILCFALIPSVVFAAEAAQDEAKTQAVERYFELAPIETLMTEMIEQVITQFPQEQRESMQQMLLENLDLNTIEGAAKTQLTANLTLDELHAFITFLEDPAGRSALGKMKHYMSGLLPVIQGEIQRSYRQIQAKGE